MEKNEVMTPQEWFVYNNPNKSSPLPGIVYDPSYKFMHEYAEYYHQAKQSIPVDVEDAIESEYSYQLSANKFNEMADRTQKDYLREAAHFGYQLNRQAIDWEKIEEDFIKTIKGSELPINHTIYQTTFDWFRSRISAGSDAGINASADAVSLCPKCNGDGFVKNPYQTSAVNIVCDVCNGTKIIMKYVLCQSDAIEFLESIRDYEHESGNQICYDERTSDELYQLFKTKQLK